LDVLCLDLEGVLVPEIWQAVARATGIDELQLTTRDIPVYDDLMQRRLGILEERAIGIAAIRDVVAGLEPLPGASEFMAWARQRYQIAVLSDTFYDLAMPLVAQLGHPLLLCHRLVLEGDRIVGYRLRQQDPKRHAVRAFKALGYRVLAAGDSFNDVTMLDAADAGIFFNAPQAVIGQYPAFRAVTGYEELKTALESVEERA
jgi:phosphoserine/homoserine phosphotransferase